MSLQYKIRDPEGSYFLTLTVVDWVDVFSRSRYAEIVLESIRYCIANKGLNLHAYVIMTNHVHLIASAKGDNLLSDIIRDFKKFTTNQIIKCIQTEPESRREWMLRLFEQAGRYNTQNKKYQLWQNGSQPIQILSLDMLAQKMNYLHDNPIRANIVRQASDYVYSSADAYAGGLQEVPLEMLW